MCSIDLDPCSVARRVSRRARKPHRCATCAGSIQSGENYHYYSWVFEGSAGSGKQCNPCRLALEQFGAAHESYPADPAYFRTLLEECLADGDDESDRVWRPMLVAMDIRKTAAQGAA